jgi:CBS domain-containing protein
MDRLPRDQWSAHTVGEVMQRDVGPIVVSPQDDAMTAMEKMQRTGSSRLLVVEEDRLVGILTLNDLLELLRLKLKLEDSEATPGSKGDS